MKILHSVYSVDPAVGGSFEAVRQFCLAHMQMGHEVEIASLDLPGSPYLENFPIPVHPLGATTKKYGYSPRFTPWIEENHRRFDAVIVNGIWQYNSYGVWKAMRKASTPYFVFTHGFLDPWHKRTYPLKHLKKWLYWPWADYRVLRDARATLFTGEEEKQRSRESFWLFKCRPRIAPLGVASPEGEPAEQREAFYRQVPFLRDRPFLLFLGRLYELKGCDYLIDSFGAIAGEYPGLYLVMAGPGEKAYVDQLRARLERFGKEIASRVVWTGMVSGDVKWGALRAADAYILPSHTENFGMAVVEALACGTPVLISREVRIWREITDDGAGWADSDDEEGTTRLLRRWLQASPEEKLSMSRNARLCYDRRFEIRQAAQHLIDVLQEETVGRSL